MTLQASGPISMQNINSVFGRGNDLNSYRGTTWWTPENSTGVFTTTNLGFNQFYNKQPNQPAHYWSGAMSFSNSSGTMIWTGSIAVGPHTCNYVGVSSNGATIRFPNGQPGSSCRLWIEGVFDATMTEWIGDDLLSNRFRTGAGASFGAGARNVQIWVYP